MKSILSLLAIFFLDLAAAHALPNLIVNGDFASGVLTPWTSTGSAVISNGVCVLNNGTISQTVATVAGSRYYLALDPNLGFSGGGVTLTAAPAAGGSPDGTKAVPPATGAIRGFLIFTASTTSTKINIAGTFAGGGFGSPPTVDNIGLFRLVPSRYVGKYTGTLTNRMSNSALGLVQRAASRLIASIDTDGRIVIFDNAARIYAGQIFQDGTFDINFNNFLRSTGTAAFGGGILNLRVDGNGAFGIDEGGNGITATTAMIVTLTRLKP